ncbi:MAG: deoxynucleoside kinase [Pseudomonadota bacterium]
MSATSPELSFVVVEGPIGVGKTALARRLAAHMGASVLLESEGHNPFLERFYQDRRGGALPAQLFFLFERARQLETLRQDDLFAATRVADFLIDKDRLFASVNLNTEELALYEQIQARLQIDAPQPDLVVYLQAPVDVLKTRLQQRSAKFDALLDRRYLERVNEAYASFFHDYDASPLLIVNAAMIDPVHNGADFNALVNEILTVPRGRRFFNPVASAIG